MDSLTRNARALRRDMTAAERHLWYDFLRTHPCRFQRQKPIDRYIVDFYCPRARLVIELDGGQHYAEAGRSQDAERDAVLGAYGLRVLRFSNAEVWKDFPGVCRRIELELQRRCGALPPFRKGRWPAGPEGSS